MEIDESMVLDDSSMFALLSDEWKQYPNQSGLATLTYYLPYLPYTQVQIRLMHNITPWDRFHCCPGAAMEYQKYTPTESSRY